MMDKDGSWQLTRREFAEFLAKVTCAAPIDRHCLRAWKKGIQRSMAYSRVVATASATVPMAAR